MENTDYFLSLSRVYDVTAPCLAKLRNGSEADTKHDIKKYNPAWVTTNLSKRHSVLSSLKFKDGCLKTHWRLCIGMIIGFYEWRGNVEQ